MDSPIGHHRERIGDPGLARALRKAVSGEVRFDAMTRALYSTDASIYQLEPLGVVFPRTVDDVSAVMEVARTEGVPVLPRGAGTSQCGQTVGHAVVLDTTRSLNRILEVDEDGGTARVQPGVVLDQLNDHLSSTGLFFPVDVATANRATLGGMAGNNSGGARSIRYGIMADNVAAIEAELPDGSIALFDASGRLDGAPAALGGTIRELVERHAEELDRRIPSVLRHVAGYNLHRLLSPDASMAELLVGSEGTLAFFRSLTLRLQPRPRHRVLGVCHFPGLVAAMDAVQHLALLEPHAIELVDRHLQDLARANPLFRKTVDRFMAVDGATTLLVEFAGNDRDWLLDSLARLEEAVGDLGTGGTVLRAEDPQTQAGIWTLRRASLSIAMSLKGDRKPVSFIEDCAIPLPALGEWATALEEIFASHGSPSIWYAHASVGCLHVRPSLSMKDPRDVETMRAMASEVHEVVRRLGGSHSGEHGDGILRSEFIEPMLGPEIASAFRTLKETFDPAGIMNPGKIVAAPAMDDRTLFRYGPDYATQRLPTVMDWSPWGGFAGAVEMCNNNGACRKLDPDVMCPSYRVTREEGDTTRGRANVLRHALSGKLGPRGLTGQEVKAALDLCVGCKACRRECPTGVDMARMKAEALHLRHRSVPPAPRERIFAHLPRAAPTLSRLRTAANLRNRSRLIADVTEKVFGISSRRSLPEWSRHPFDDEELPTWDRTRSGSQVVLFADTFHRYFDPEVLRSAVRIMKAEGGRTPVSGKGDGSRPLCCGRTYVSAGFLDHAAAEMERSVRALFPLVDAGLPLVGVEPSCILTFRDEVPALLDTPEARAVSEAAVPVDEYLARHLPGLRSQPARPEGEAVDVHPFRRAHIHGHCHQKALGDAGATARVLSGLTRLEVHTIQSSCCGMAGSFGYEAEHVDTSLAMGELTLFPAVRSAGPEDAIVANGFSCRAQIAEGTGRRPLHLVQLLDGGPPRARPR